MAIAQKRKRKINVLGRNFVWHANDEWTLHVASVDKQFVVAVSIIFEPWRKWPDDFIPLLVSGPEFPGLNKKRDVWIKCPVLTIENTAPMPGVVRRLIEWCFSSNKRIEIISQAGAEQGSEDDGCANEKPSGS